MNNPHNRPAYAGRLRNIVIAIDFGTTFSGVSYAVLEPGVPSQVRSVTGFPGQEDNSSSTKVPTIIYYDRQGKVRAVGAQTNDLDIMCQDGFEDWLKVEWFKFLLRPKETYAGHPDVPKPVLPPRKTLPMVLGDFLRYLKDCAEDYIRKTHAEGQVLLTEVSGRIEYVLSHPNGWDGFQQGQMRSAAIHGGLIPSNEVGRGRIHFVSEGEASFHWCVDSGLAGGCLERGFDVVVADAGGGTIDISAFRVESSVPLKLAETKPAECRLAGSVFVTQAFNNFIEQHLQNSAYGDAETISHLVGEFDRKSKRIFRDTSLSVTIQFGRPGDPPEPSFGIKGGKLTISKDLVIQFFERSISSLVDAVKSQIKGNSHTTVFLVGGFAASPFLYADVQRRLKGFPVTIKRAESHTAKAVSDGAIGYFLDRYVDARVAKYTYGIFGNPIYDDKDRQHTCRMSKVYTESGSGRRMVLDKFYPYVRKGTAVRETTAHREDFWDIVGPTRKEFDAEFVLYCYKGNKNNIEWKDEDPNNFRPVCKFTAVLPESAAKKSKSPKGGKYWKVKYQAVVTFGTTEFGCHVEWTNGSGQIERGAMTAVWDEG